MCLSWLGIILQGKGSLVRFPVTAQAWVVGWVLDWGECEATDQCFSLTSVFPSLSFFLPSSVSKKSIDKIFEKIDPQVAKIYCEIVNVAFIRLCLIYIWYKIKRTSLLFNWDFYSLLWSLQSSTSGLLI